MKYNITYKSGPDFSITKTYEYPFDSKEEADAFAEGMRRAGSREVNVVEVKEEKPGVRISKVKISKTYGKYGVRLLREGGFITAAGKGWFGVNKELPTVEAFNEVRNQAFTRNVGDVVEEATATIEELRDELQEWYDNMPENFQSGSKGDDLQQAIDELESAHGQYNDSIPDAARELKVYISPNDEYSRPARAGQASYMLNQAAEVVTERAEKIREEIDAIDAEKASDEELKQAEAKEQQESELKEFAEELENIANDLENVSFPGMF